jgi:hypothetical protein
MAPTTARNGKGILTEEAREELLRKRETAAAPPTAEDIEPALPFAPSHPLAAIGLGSSGVIFVRKLLDVIRAWGLDARSILYDPIQAQPTASC